MAAGIVRRSTWGGLFLVLASGCGLDLRDANPVCGSDSDCDEGQFCDRGLACRSPIAGHPFGNDCDEDQVITPENQRHARCGSYYICTDGMCRSCLSDDECPEGQVCHDADTYGHACGMPKSSPAEPPATAPATSGTATTESTLSLQECQVIASKARQADPGTKTEVAQCEVDSDCRQFVYPVQKCWGECKYWPNLGSEERQAAIAAAFESSAASALCEQFWDNGCQVIPISCPPPSEPIPWRFVCSDGACVSDEIPPQSGATIDGGAPLGDASSDGEPCAELCED